MSSAIPTITLLLVEDDEEDFILLRKHLSRIAGVRYEILWAPTYEQGLASMREGMHDLCLLDYQLGLHNGIELIAEARQSGCTLPIVLLTTANGSEIDIRALQAGADDYIDKGHLQSELLHRVIRYAIERKKAEQERERLLREQVATRESEERFRTLANHTPLMIWSSDAGGSCTYVNQTWCTFTGYSEEESLGTGWFQAIHPDEREQELAEWRQAHTERENYQAQFRLLRCDNAYRYVLVYSAPRFDQHGTFFGYIGTMVDITEQKELEYQQEAFVSMATHELKTPLTALQGNIQLAERRLRRILHSSELSDDERQQQVEAVLTMLERGQQQLRIQTRLINDLLEMSRIHTDDIELQVRPCDLRLLVTETVQDQRVAHPDRIISLTLPEQDPIPAQVDPVRIGQALNNYIVNALKYSSSDAPVEVGLRVEDEQVCVCVHDHGPGLPPEAQERVWRRFYQVPGIHAQNGRTTSLGLGLYICQKLIRLHGGQVGVHSEVGRGSTFWFTLPYAAEREGSAAASNQAIQQ